MPDLDGIGVIEALRGQGNPLPVILCSAALTPNAALRAIRHGVVDFLLKPVRPVDLRQVVEFVIRPENRPLPQALKAARNGRPDQAIRLLESEPAPSCQIRHWLKLLRTIRDAGSQDDVLLAELEILTSLPALAFNAPTVA
jgi:DNA-binding NtrC family response regulator